MENLNDTIQMKASTIAFSNFQKFAVARRSHRRCSVKKYVFKISANFTRKQMFSCEICGNFKKTYSEEHLQTAASERRI